MWLLAAAVRDTPPAQLASLSDGLPLLLGRILNASVAPSSPPSAGSATGKPGASLGDECEVPSDHVELQIACCGALEALLDGCTAVQVRFLFLRSPRCLLWYVYIHYLGVNRRLSTISVS